jgi:hypothetical protein
MRDAAAPVRGVEIAGRGGEHAFRPDETGSEEADLIEIDHRGYSSSGIP